MGWCCASPSGLKPVQRWRHISFCLTLHSSPWQMKSVSHQPDDQTCRQEWLLDVWTELSTEDESDQIFFSLVLRGQEQTQTTRLTHLYLFTVVFSVAYKVLNCITCQLCPSKEMAKQAYWRTGQQFYETVV